MLQLKYSAMSFLPDYMVDLSLQAGAVKKGGDDEIQNVASGKKTQKKSDSDGICSEKEKAEMDLSIPC